MVVEHSLSGNNSPLFSAFATEAVIYAFNFIIFITQTQYVPLSRARPVEGKP